MSLRELSPQQRQVLRWLLENSRLIEELVPDLTNAPVDYRVSVDDRTSENARRASFSRTMRRLEQRGLISKVKGAANRRTLRVALTSEGRRVAEAIPATF
jgi:DNA-binding MarR family transcriptional regulator